jgi:hypothetical protein
MSNSPLFRDDPFQRHPAPPVPAYGAPDEAVRGQRPTIESVEGLQQALRERTSNQDRTEGTAASVVGADGKLNAVRKHSTWGTPSAYPTVVKMVDGSVSVTLNSSGLEINDGTYTVQILFADFARNVAMREIDVNDSGTAKKILLLASAAYT